MGRNLVRALAEIAALRTGHPGPVLITDYWNVFTDGDVARRAGGETQIDWSTQVTAVANKEICAAARSASCSGVGMKISVKSPAA